MKKEIQNHRRSEDGKTICKSFTSKEFMLIELLDVIAIIAILASILLPALKHIATSGLGAIGYYLGESYVHNAGIPYYLAGNLTNNPGQRIDDSPFFIRFSHAMALKSGFPGSAKSVNDLPIYGDSWVRPDESSKLSQFGNVIGSFVSSEKGSFHIRHSNRANCWFLDGRVEQIDTDYAGNKLKFNWVLGQRMNQIFLP